MEKFNSLYDTGMCDNPIIFCDNATVETHENIPVFSSLHMKQKFHKYIILTDIDNIKYLNDDQQYIIVYNKIMQEPPKEIKTFVDKEDDVLPLIKDMINERI